MNDRLKQFLEMESLTPTRFAEMMDIQRSGLSHLLSGRNKPSFEFIQKMMTTFPSLNYEWLILGKGKPYKEPVPATNSYNEPSDNPKIPFDTVTVTEEKESNIQEEVHQPKVNQRVDAEISQSEPSENPIFLKSPSTVSRNISRITIFYSDGTFEER